MRWFHRKRTDSWDENSPRISSLEIAMDYDKLEKKKTRKATNFHQAHLRASRVKSVAFCCVLLYDFNNSRTNCCDYRREE